MQTARFALSLLTRSCREADATAPSPASPLTASGLKSETTIWGPPRIRRRVMFAPMRPNPTIPICIECSPHEAQAPRAMRRLIVHRGAMRDFCQYPAVNLPQGLFDRCQQCAQPRLEIGPEMHAQGAAAALGQNLEITTGLCGLHRAERVFLPGHREVVGVIACELQEYSGVGAALIGLPGRVQKARTKAQARSDVLFVAHGVPDRLQQLLVRVVHLDIAQQREVVAGLQAAEMGFQ